jgi:hypothetical protein
MARVDAKVGVNRESTRVRFESAIVLRLYQPGHGLCGSSVLAPCASASRRFDLSTMEPVEFLDYRWLSRNSRRMHLPDDEDVQSHSISLDILKIYKVLCTK